MTAYENIKLLCEQNKVSFNKVEKEAGVGRGNIARWATHVPSMDKLKKVADYFNVSVDFLLGRDETAKVSDDELKFALFGGDSEITDEMYAEVKRFAEWVKERERNKEK